MVNLAQQEDAIIDSVVQHVFEDAERSRSKLPFDRKSTRMMAESLLKAMEDGYGSALSDLTPGTPDYNMMQALGRNIYVFSAAKNWQMCREVTRNLVEDGKVVSFGKFRQKSAQTLKQWVGPWMQAEYSHALASSQMAGNWVELQNSPAEKLRYLTVNDRRVRPSHAKLHNICLPKDDAFWNTWYPPNGWLCRCNVISDSSGKLTDKSKIEYPDTKEAPEAFRFNPGKKKVIFPPDHPYYKNIEKGNLLPALLEMPREYQFDKIGDNLFEHVLVDKTSSDYSQISAAAKWLAKNQNERVEILSKVFPVDPSYDTIFPNLLGTIYEGKSPDIRVGDRYFEVEGHLPDSKNPLRNMLNRAYKQAPNIIIEDEGSTNNYILKIIRNRIAEGQTISSLHILREGKILEKVY